MCFFMELPVHLLHFPVLDDVFLQLLSQRLGACEEDTIFSQSGALGLDG